MKYLLMGFVLSTSCAPMSVIAMNHQRATRLVDWTETTNPQKNTRTINCQVSDASYYGVKGLIAIEREHCIISGRLLRIIGTITQNTGRAFPIAPTDISTCFDQISALRLVDLRNEAIQRAEKEKNEGAKQALNAKKYIYQSGWRAAHGETK